MKILQIDLEQEEEKLFEFKMYHFQGLQIALSQFLNTGTFEYNEEHYNRLVDSYMEKYRALLECISDLLEARNHKGIPIQNMINFEYTKGILKLHLPN